MIRLYDECLRLVDNDASGERGMHHHQSSLAYAQLVVLYAWPSTTVVPSRGELILSSIQIHYIGSDAQFILLY